MCTDQGGRKREFKAGQEPSTQPLQTSLLGLVCTLCTLRAHKIIKLSESLGRKAG